jgi:hypothetical protein
MQVAGEAFSEVFFLISSWELNFYSSAEFGDNFLGDLWRNDRAEFLIEPVAADNPPFPAEIDFRFGYQGDSLQSPFEFARSVKIWFGSESVLYSHVKSVSLGFAAAI